MQGNAGTGYGSQKSGLAGIHFQSVRFGTVSCNLSGFDSGERAYSPAEVLPHLPFESVTHYQFVHFADMNQQYPKIVAEAEAEWNRTVKECSIPYFPHVSIGWDNTPRYSTHTDSVVKGNTPEEFKKALADAKAFSDQHNQIPLITINSWNEWTETSYLQPDDRYGYGYLNAVKEVFG